MFKTDEMTATLLTLLLIGSLAFLMMIVKGREKICKQSRFIVIFFLFYFVDNLSITLPNYFPSFQIVPNHIWNGFLLCTWSGKAYSISIVLILLYSFRLILPFEIIGITFKQNKGSLFSSAGIILLIVLWSSFVGSRFPKGDFDITTLVYLAIMPGVNEELVYRGVLPACLDRLFSKNWILASAEIGWSTLITTALFGLLHGLWLDNHLELHIEIVWIRNALLSGFIFAWLKERTGSLAISILAHGAWDFYLFLFRMI